MGTWSVPYENEKSAKKFHRCMSRPWIAKVVYDKEHDDYSWQLKGLYHLFGDDGLFDGLDSKSNQKKDFDIRPLVKKSLVPWLKEMELSLYQPAPLSCINLVRTAVGLKSLNKNRPHKGVQRILKKILELLDTHKIKYDYLALYARVVRGKKMYGYEITMHKGAHQRKMEKILEELSLEHIAVTHKGRRVIVRINPQSVSNFKLASEQLSFSLRYNEGKSDKFWQAKCKAKSVIIAFGRTGTKGRTLTKKFSNPSAALDALHKLAHQKKQRGYR